MVRGRQDDEMERSDDEYDRAGTTQEFALVQATAKMYKNGFRDLESWLASLAPSTAATWRRKLTKPPDTPAPKRRRRR